MQIYFVVYFLANSMFYDIILSGKEESDLDHFQDEKVRAMVRDGFWSVFTLRINL